MICQNTLQPQIPTHFSPSTSGNTQHGTIIHEPDFMIWKFGSPLIASDCQEQTPVFDIFNLAGLQSVNILEKIRDLSREEKPMILFVMSLALHVN